MKDLFWEDAQQARDRLSNTVVLYGDDPVFIGDVRPDGPVVKADVTFYPTGKFIQLNLADSRFHKFRTLPPLGWVNNTKDKTAYYLERRVRRTTRHGLFNDNTSCLFADLAGGGVIEAGHRFSTISQDLGFSESCKGLFPTLEEVLTNVKQGNIIAISNSFAIGKNPIGAYLLYHHKICCGIFTDLSSVLLFQDKKYLRETLQQAEILSLRDIKEF